MKTNPFKNLANPLVLLAFILAVIGLANLYSATITPESRVASEYFKAQLFYTVIGILVMFVVSFLSVPRLYSLTPWGYVLSIGMLGLVLVLGTEKHGAMSWLDLGFVRLQPSELGKFGLVMVLARYFANLQKDAPLSFGEMIVAGFLFLIPTGLVVAQNDLGSSLFYGFIFGSLLLIQGIKFRYIVVALVIVGVVGIGSYQFLLKPYQKNRIVSFMKPELDPRGSGYHMVQSKIAVGSGGFFGKGYLKGQSHQLKFLPERHTDFIFPVLAEEWGFFGGTVMVALYMAFLIAGLKTALKAETRFGYFLAAGVVVTYFWHLVINLGGVLGLLPLTGVPLPFLSYGGSSLVANWMAIGFLLSVRREK